jgi:hypothetical protein
MDLSQSEYLQRITLEADKLLKNSYTFSKSEFSSFEIINSFLFLHIYHTEGANLLITLPAKDQLKLIIDVITLIPVLKCFILNASVDKSINIGDIIIKVDCGSISSVKAVTDEHIQVLPTLTTKRSVVDISNPFLLLNSKIKAKIAEIESRVTLEQKQKGLENIRSKLLEEIQQYRTITKYYIDRNIPFPAKHEAKVIIIASKKDFLSFIPSCIPFQYINKRGDIYPDTPFDPILYVANDIATAKEFIIDKNFEVDTIIFVGDNKYKTTTAISRLYRQGKIKRCVFIGTEDIESTDKFKVLKWNWTLPEIKHFYNATNSQVNTIRVLHTELSESILEYIKIIDASEQQNEHLINLKKALRYIRRIYPTTALNNERIKSRANDIFKEFEKEVEELFQDEYQSIDKDYKSDFGLLKDQFRKIIGLIKNENAKAEWFKNKAKDVDYIVVPKVIKSYWDKEIKNCLQSQYAITKVKSLADLNSIQHKEQSMPFYKGLKDTQIITLKEFEQKEADNKRYLFISFYGNGVYSETLLERIYAKNVISEILLYEEEYKAFQYHIYKFNERTIQEFRSADREELTGIKYSEKQSFNTEDIDEWIKFLIDSEGFKLSKKEEIRYEITFEEENRKIRERESKNVYVEEHEEHHKEIKDLKKGDKVRIYQNPDINTLHEIIKLYDENELFSRVENFSILWKSALKNYLQGKEFTFTITNLFEELLSNGLSDSKDRLEEWLLPGNQTKFPKRKIDFSAIVKTVNNDELNNKWKIIMETSKEYLGTLNHKGRKFAEEIDIYILSGEKGEMLDWLNKDEIEKIIDAGAPLRTIKEIKKLDYEIID